MVHVFGNRLTRSLVASAAVAVGPATLFAADPPDNSKNNETLTIQFPGKPEQKVKVLKTNRKPDGTVETEVKDIATGETFTLIDNPKAESAKSTNKGSTSKSNESKVDDAKLPKAKPRGEDPMTSTNLKPMSDTPADKKAASGKSTKDTSESETAKKPGFLTRLFGPKKSSTPPAPSVTATANTAKPNASTPTTGLSTKPPTVLSSVPDELPQRMPAKPIVPPAPPQLVPSIPVPSGNPQSFRLTPGIQSANYVASSASLPLAVQKFADSLRDALPPSTRLTAAKGLADGPEGSSDQVKLLLFQAAKSDPCPEVRAACIEHLCKLGYYEPAFMAHLKKSVNDSSEDVREAAKNALVKMTPH